MNPKGPISRFADANGNLPPLAGADPSTDTATIDDVRSAVATLTDAVGQMREGLVDRETVERIAAEVVEAQRAAERDERRSGYQGPDDRDGEPVTLTGTPEQRANALLQRRATSVAAATRRPVEDIVELQRSADNVVLLEAAMKRANPDYDVRESRLFQEEYLPQLRAVDTATSAEGTEYVPTALSANLIQRVSLQLKVLDLFPSIEMPTPTFELPGVAVSRTRLGKHAEQTADSSQTGFTKITPGTRKVTLTAKKFAGEILVSREEEEDAIIAVLPWLQGELVDYLAADLEDTAVNGDTTATHQDSNVTASDDPRKNWNGLRKLAQSGQKTDASNAALTVAMLRANRKTMGKYGVDPAKLAHILSINAYIDLLGDSNVQTLEKYGPNATILQGELAKVDNVPIVVSEYVKTDLNATGVYDGTTTNRTEALTVHRGGYIVGNRRNVTQQTLRELYAEYDQDAILISTRKAFAGLYGTQATVAIHYNVKT